MTAGLDTAPVDPTNGRIGGLPRRRTISLVPPPVQLPPAAVPSAALPSAAISTGPFPTRPILTQREIQVLTGWIKCDSKVDVAKSLFLSLGTVNTHLTRIRAKYAAVGRPASTKASLVARALQDGLLDINEL